MKYIICYLAFFAIVLYLLYAYISFGRSQVQKDIELEQIKYEKYMKSLGH